MPKRVAIITTIYRYLSHAQHMGDRFLIGYPLHGKWHKGDMQVVSLYVDQKPEGDQSQERAKEFGFQVYPTISEEDYQVTILTLKKIIENNKANSG